MPFSRESFQPRDQSQVFCVAGSFFICNINILFTFVLKFVDKRNLRSKKVRILLKVKAV